MKGKIIQEYEDREVKWYVNMKLYLEGRGELEKSEVGRKEGHYRK